MTPKEFAGSLALLVKDHFAKAVAPLLDRLGALEGALKSLPAPQVGPKGERGESGKDADPEAMRAAVAAEVARQMALLPKPQDGARGEAGKDGAQGLPGKDADPELMQRQVAEEVAKQLALIPKPKDGEPGRPGDPGKSVSIDEVRALVEEAVKALPPPKNGVDGKDGQPGKQGEPGKSVTIDEITALVMHAVQALPPAKDGAAGAAGKDGEPGRDAIAIEILPYIEPDRAYPRNTFACHGGGLVRAARTTDYLDTMKAGETVESKGWMVVWNGVADTQVEHKDPRNVVIRLVHTNGKVTEKTLAIPAVIDRGVFRQGEETYQKGDGVTYGGSYWIAVDDKPAGKPGDQASGWRLSVKRGRDGKDGKAHADR